MPEIPVDRNAGAHRLTVYYDGQCPLCRAEIGFYARRPGAGAIRFVDASDECQTLGDDLDRCTALGRFHVRRVDGQLLSGAAGFTAIWEVLPGWRWLAWLARRPAMPWLMERAYRGFLKLRPGLSRLAGRIMQARRATQREIQ